MPDGIENQELRPFLSIRWKLFGILVSMLVAIYIIFTFTFYRFQQDVTIHNELERVVDSKYALNTGLNLLHTVVYNAVESFLVNANKLEVNPLDAVIKDITNKSVDLIAAGQVDGIVLTSTDSSIVQQWGSTLSYSNSLLKSDNANGFACELTCFVYVSLPVKKRNKTIGILVAHKEINSLLANFSAMTGIVANVVNKTHGKLSATNWSEELKAFSNSRFSLPILNQLSNEHENALVDIEYLVTVFGNNHSVIFSDFDGATNNSIQKGYQWVFIKNINDRKKWLALLKNKMLMWIVLSFILALFFLYIVVDRFSGHLSKMLAMSKAINLESNLNYSRSVNSEKKILDDELQQYDRHLAKISNKLDVLREAESNNAIKLQTMVRELNQTKSFIDRLLNDDQTVIMVQRLGGEIIALNEAGKDLFQVDDFFGITYSELLCADISTDDGLAALNYLYLGGETLVKAEAQWTNKSGDVYTLLWVHTLLSVPGTIDPVILSICVDITAQRKAEDRLEWLAFNDPSLINYNKQVFLEYLPFAISRSLERQKYLALLYCEVSGLPEKTGMGNSEIRDKIIKDVGVRMSNNLRQYDMLTQLSDDHFVIILEGLSSISEAENAVKDVITTYTESIEVGRKEYSLKVVIGVSYAPEHTTSVPELVRNAELAQCEAKRQGIDFISYTEHK